MKLLIVFFLLTTIQAQQDPCLCSCCTDISCQPTSLPTVYVQTCTLQSCIERCIGTYSQCQRNHPQGYISVQCPSNNVPSFNCRCDCCNTGSTTCTPVYVGITQVYSCQTSACSIACENQYPLQCKADQSGTTQGTCISVVNTTTATTTIDSWLDNTCRCTSCQAAPTCSSVYVGVALGSSCSVPACTQACQNKYSSNISQTSGTCLSNTGEFTFCNCRCCSTNGCINYKINTNVGCNMCDSTCRQYSPCDQTASITVQTCSTINNVKIYFPSGIFIFYQILFLFFSCL